MATCWWPNPTIRRRRPASRRSTASRPGSPGRCRSAPAPARRAPTASRCCATPMATASRNSATCSSPGCIRPSAWRWWATRCTSPTPTRSCACPMRPARSSGRRPRQGRRPARRPQPPLDQDAGGQPRRPPPLCQRRLQQQHRRERPGEGGRTRGHLGNRSWQRPQARIRDRPAQCRGARVRPAHRRPVDRGQRTRRAGQRPRAGLPHVRARRRLLRLALELLGRARGRTRAAAAARDGGAGHRPRLRARQPRRAPGPGLQRRRCLRRPGIASRSVATRWCSCPSRTASRRDCPATC